MSEPTIEDVVSEEYWESVGANGAIYRAIGACEALRAVLQELEGCGSVWVSPDGTKTFGTYDPYLLKKFLDRIRAALGDEK